MSEHLYMQDMVSGHRTAIYSTHFNGYRGWGVVPIGWRGKDMVLAVVRMLMRVYPVGKSTPESPKANANKNNADKPFGPGGHQVERQQASQPKRQKTHRDHPRGVSTAPAPAG